MPPLILLALLLLTLIIKVLPSLAHPSTGSWAMAPVIKNLVIYPFTKTIVVMLTALTQEFD